MTVSDGSILPRRIWSIKPDIAFPLVKAGKLLDLLTAPQDRRRFANLGDADALTPGTALPAPTGVFPRYVEREAVAS